MMPQRFLTLLVGLLLLGIAPTLVCWNRALAVRIVDYRTREPVVDATHMAQESDFEPYSSIEPPQIQLI
jgi:hypothetical protein